MVENKNIQLLLDVGSLQCPLPLLRIKASLARISTGQVLEVKGIFVTHIKDIEDWCSRSGNTILDKEQSSTQSVRILIRKL